jgi:hypothetical protein
MIGIPKNLVANTLNKVTNKLTAEKNIKDFYDEYFKQDIVINEKLSKCSDSEKRKRLNDFRDDIDYLKSLFDEILFNIDNGNFKVIKLMVKIGKFSIDMDKKYKKEDCDINNFKV